MGTFKLLMVLCLAILTCYCEESPAKGNVTSHLEKESDSKPIAQSATVQKLAKQIASPEHSLNANADGQQQQQQPSRRNPEQNLRQGRALDNREQSQPSVRYQGQPQSNPSTYGRPSSIDQDQPQPAYQRNPSTDPRQRRRFDPNENQDSPARDLTRTPQYARPATARDQDYDRQHRVQYRDPSALSRDEQSYKPYSFNYIAETEEGTTSHQQAADASGRVSGSYSMSLDDGRKRVVDYIADENGFRANVDTNEPGTSSAENPASVVYSSSNPRLQGHEFRGTSNRLQPQPQQQQPRAGRSGYRTETRVTSSVSGPFRGNYGWTAESQPNRDQAQFRSGREDMAEADAASNEDGQTRSQGLQRSNRDGLQGISEVTSYSSPYNPYPHLRTDRGYQGRPSRPISRDSQSPNLSSPRRDFRQSVGPQPVGNRTPLNTVPSSTLDDQNYVPNTDRSGRTNPRLQYNPPQANEFASSGRRNVGNEPSYGSDGWSRPSGNPMEQSPMPGFRSQRDPFAAGAQPEEGSGSVYQPPIRNVNLRPQRQPSWSRSNYDGDSQQPLAGRYSPRSGGYPEDNARPQYNRNEQFRPNSQSAGRGYQDNIRSNQIPLNIAQPSSDRSNIPEVPAEVQSPPDSQRPRGRGEYIIPQTMSPSSDIPQGYRNYGTYWYYGY